MAKTAPAGFTVSTCAELTMARQRGGNMALTLRTSAEHSDCIEIEIDGETYTVNADDFAAAAQAVADAASKA